MTIPPPQFWRKNTVLSHILSPLGWVYSQIVKWRLSGYKKKVSVPVICVGNLSMGGAGKTPTVIALVQEFQRHGHTPHILSRGYGGTAQKALKVEIGYHTARNVGDEPLLLAQVAPTWVGADRYASANAAIQAGATLLIMDDGLQNPFLHQDYKIAVFDGQIPLENTLTFPAGPMRENFQDGLKRIDHVILINFSTIPDWATNKPYTLAETITDASPTTSRYLAFAGIGYPEKFYNLLTQKGFNLVSRQSFADHYEYTSKDIDQLLQQAQQYDAKLITTEKDLVKIPKNVRKNIQSLKIYLRGNFGEIVNKVLKFF